MPILIGSAANAWRTNAGAATSAEPATVASSTRRRVIAFTRYFSFLVLNSSHIVQVCYGCLSQQAERISRSLQLHGLELSRQDDFEQLAVVGIIQHCVLDPRRLQPGRARPHRHLALPLEFRSDPALQDIDHLHMYVVIVPLRNHRGIA